MTVHDHPERVKALQRGDLAARMVTIACDLACLVRDAGREEIGAFLAGLTRDERDALLIVQAAMIDVETPAANLLSWVTWDEYGRPLPGPVREIPLQARRPGPAATQPCGTYAAYSRHKDRGELTDDECQEAARAYWRERDQVKKDRRAAAVLEAAAAGDPGEESRDAA